MTMAGISEEEEKRFQAFIAAIKARVKENDVESALIMAKNALKIRDSEKLRQRIKKMEDYINALQEDSAEEGEDMSDLGDGFFLAKQLSNKLYDYQREGVRWLWNLFRTGKGGILGDDMGLGKTLQIISLLAGMLDLQKIKNAIIVMPLTLVANWQAEFNKWTPGIEVEDFHGLTKRQRQHMCEKVQRRGGIILITYGMILNNWELLSEYRGRQFVWDYVILDEGHKIKNASKTTKSVHQVPAANRLILTGTPIQNNLLELWSLYDFVHSGTLLGTAATFKFQFSNPILKSREKNATKEEKRLGERMAEVLRHRIEPYFLRRLKEEVLAEPAGDCSSNRKVPKAMTHKNDFVAWICLEEEQVEIYQKCLNLEMITEALQTKRSPLVQLTILKKICDHPRLLSARLSESLGLLDKMDNYFEGDKMVATQMLHMLSDKQLLQESGKLKFLIDLLNNLRAEGHKCLVFSQSRVMLDIIERILKNARFKIARIDGTVTSPSERQERIRRFENDSSYSVFLLTTQIGGVGLTLTSANRVVIYDPSWNPAQDSQAVDRVYRIGQMRSVVVYRLITCGTVEERIYRRQVFKQSIHKQTVEKNEEDICRYFSRQELRDMFTLEDPRTSTTQMQLESMHAASRKTTTELDGHIAFLYSIPGFFGISDHDLLFTVNTEDNEVLDDVGQKHVGDWMERANKLVDLECEMTNKARSEQGRFLKPVMPESRSGVPLSLLSSQNLLPRPPAANPVSPKREDSRSPVANPVPPKRKDLRSPVANPVPPKRKDLKSSLESTRHQFIGDEVDELAQDVEMLSPFKPSNYGDYRNLQTDDRYKNEAHSIKDVTVKKENGISEIIINSSQRNAENDFEIINLVTPNKTSNFNEVSLVKTVMTENKINSNAEQDRTSTAVLEDESDDSKSERSESGSVLAPDSESEEKSPLKTLEQPSQFVVNESMDVSVIESVSPALIRHVFSAKGPLNSTRISSVAVRQQTPSSEDEDSVDPMNESYHSVQSDDHNSQEIFQSFSGSPTTAKQPVKAESTAPILKSPMDEKWSAIVLPAAPSPIKDRVKASKLRRSSMFVRVANEIEDEDSYSDSASNEEDESESSVESDQSAQSDDVSVRSDDVSVRSDDVSARSDDVSARSDDVSARSDDVSARSDDVSARSEELSVQNSEMDSPIVTIKSAKKKYRRIVVPSDSDTD